MAILNVIALLIGSASSKIAADEASAWLPVLSRWLLDLALSRLPSDQTERFREEWTADLLDYPGAASRAIRALGICMAAWKIGLANSDPASSPREAISAYFKNCFRYYQSMPSGDRLAMWTSSLGAGIAGGISSYISRNYMSPLVAFGISVALISPMSGYFMGRTLARRTLRRVAAEALVSEEKKATKV